MKAANILFQEGKTVICLIREQKVKNNIVSLSHRPVQRYGKDGVILWFCFKAYEVSQLHGKVQNRGFACSTGFLPGWT